MIKFFRKIRQKLLSENKFSKYLLYAFGEIVLVVIGILIALQINNWNENRITKTQLKYIYQIVLEDLNTDLKNLESPIAFYENLENTIQGILTTNYSGAFLDSINESNYSECIPCKSNISYYEPFFNQNKGFELLKNFKNNDDSQRRVKEDLSQDIVQFYTTHTKKLESILEVVGSEALNNLKYYDQFYWYSDYIIGKYNPDAVAFFLQDQSYKNKAANFQIFAVKNYLRDLKNYKDDLINIKKRIKISTINK